MSNTKCEKHEDLLVRAQSILQKIHDITEGQKTLVGSEGVSSEFIRFDKEVELLMGEKERAVGALREHDEEHGCQIDPDR